MDKKTRYQSFDVLKGISCIAVVLIHYPFTGFLSDAGQYIRAACRFAVPVFFAISGFFLPSSDGHITDAGILRKIRHVLRLLIGSGLFYLAFCVAWNVLSNGSFSPYAYILKEIEPWDIVKFVFLNQPFVYSHLWYLLALLYCYTFALLLMKDGKAAKYIAWLAPLLLGMTLLQEFSAYLPFEATLTFPGTKLQLLIFNTFIFRAMPFFLFGYLARLYREKLNAVKLPNWLLFLLAIIGCAAGGAEHFLIGKSCQFYISTYLSCASMLLLATEINFARSKKGCHSFSSKTRRKLFGLRRKSNII